MAEVQQKRKSIPKFFQKQEADPTAVPKGIDRSTFFQGPIPREVRAAVPLLHTLEVELAKRLINEIALFLEQVGGVDGDAVAKLNTVFKPNLFEYLADMRASVVVTGLYTIMKTCVGHKVRSQHIEADLGRMNVPQALRLEIIDALRRARPDLESAALSRRLRCAQISKFRWRIDVTMSTGLLSKVMRPSILVQMSLSSGVIKTFEISIEQFNQLRYGVAKVLQEMQRVKRHPILKIINEDERKDAEARCK